MNGHKIVAISLLAVAILLLVVGIESGTIARHIIQIIPIVTVVPVAFRDREHGLPPALAVLLFWFIVMVLIWLHLMNVTHILQGTFTTLEIIITLMIALMCLVGILKVFREGFRPSYFALFIFTTSLFYTYGFLSLSYGRFLFIP